MHATHCAALSRILHGRHGRHVERQREDRVADRQRAGVASASRPSRRELDDELFPGTHRRRQARSGREGERSGDPRCFDRLSVRVGVTTDQLDHVRVLTEDDRCARLYVPRRCRSGSARVSSEAVAQQVPANSRDVNHTRGSAPVESHLAAEPARCRGSECKLQNLLLTSRQSKWDRWWTDKPESAAGQADALHRARYAPDIGYHQGRLGRDVGRLATEIDDASGWDCNRGPSGQRVAERKVRHPADEVYAGQLRDDARGVVLALGRHL